MLEAAKPKDFANLSEWAESEGSTYNSVASSYFTNFKEWYKSLEP